MCRTRRLEAAACSWRTTTGRIEEPRRASQRLSACWPGMPKTISTPCASSAATSASAPVRTRVASGVLMALLAREDVCGQVGRVLSGGQAGRHRGSGVLDLVQDDGRRERAGAIQLGQVGSGWKRRRGARYHGVAAGARLRGEQHLAVGRIATTTRAAGAARPAAGRRRRGASPGRPGGGERGVRQRPQAHAGGTARIGACDGDNGNHHNDPDDGADKRRNEYLDHRAAHSTSLIRMTKRYPLSPLQGMVTGVSNDDVLIRMLDRRDIQTLMYCIPLTEISGQWQTGYPVRTPHDLECKLAAMLQQVEGGAAPVKAA